jgi:hypothetical protein
MASLVPDIVLIFKTGEERRELHYKRLPFTAWQELKANLGFTPLSLISGIGEFDLEAVGAVIWLERKQGDRKLRWSEVRRELESDEIEFEFLVGLEDGKVIFGDEEEAEAEAAHEPEEELDPTTPGA